MRDIHPTARFLTLLSCGFAVMIFWVAAALAQSEQRLASALDAATPAEPLMVTIGVLVDQITDVDQKSENFGVEAVLRVEWIDSKLAFDADEFGRDFKMYTIPALVRLVDERGILTPSFVIHNQQGKRFSEEQHVILFSNGLAVYLERFSTTLQAPDFNFVQYPLDSQQFFIHIDSTWPVSYVQFQPMQEFSRLGEQLGEEEWIFGDTSATVSEIEGISGKPSSRFTLGFIGHRHLDYYVLRIFIPLTIIILVSWITFFLKDFSKRVDIGGGNLLIFVAFNFTISDNLPKLGYVTFLDAIVVVAFLLTGLVMVVNVIFRRMEVAGREDLARQIDQYTIWIYPVSLTMLVLLCWYLYGWIPGS
jgi:hypothetical protein